MAGVVAGEAAVASSGCGSATRLAGRRRPRMNQAPSSSTPASDTIDTAIASGCCPIERTEIGMPGSRLSVVVRTAGRGVVASLEGRGDSALLGRGLGFGAAVAAAGRVVGLGVGFAVGFGVGFGVGRGVGAGVVPGFGLCEAFGAACAAMSPLPSRRVLASADPPNAAVSASTTARDASDILARFDIDPEHRRCPSRRSLSATHEYPSAHRTIRPCRDVESG